MNKPLTFLLSLTFLFIFGCGEEVKKEFYESGKLKRETHYKNGQKDGLETSWYKSGKKKYELPYKNGEKDGLETSWYKSGEKKLEVHYKNGEEEELETSWYESGENEHLNKSNIIDEERLTQCNKDPMTDWESIDTYFDIIQNRDWESLYKLIGEGGIGMVKKDFAPPSYRLFNPSGRGLAIEAKDGTVHVVTEFQLKNNINLIFNNSFMVEFEKDKGKCLDRSGGWRDYLEWTSPKDNVGIYFLHDGNYNYFPINITNKYLSISDFILPSFNCDKAKSKSEKTICSDSGLSRLDFMLNEKYQKSKKNLSGKEYGDLIPNQRQFLKERDQCGNDKTCLSKIMETRTTKLDKLIEGELSKSPLKIPKEKLDQMINGKWRSGTIRSSGYCGNNNYNEMGPYSVLIDLPKIVITEHGSTWECRVKETYVSNFYKEKEKLAGRDSLRWGSCGGSWDSLNYFGTITVLKLETSSRDHSFIGDSFLDLGCQNIVVSSNDGETSLVLGHRNTLPDNLLADMGFILERQ